MLGPSGYQPRILRGVDLPMGITGVFGAPDMHELDACIVGIGLRAVTQVEMWRRLFDAEFGERPSWRAGYLADRWNPADLEAARDMLPPSRRWQLALWESRDQSWQQLLSPEKVFAVFPKPRVIIAGPANEDAWDEAQAIVIGSAD